MTQWSFFLRIHPTNTNMCISKRLVLIKGLPYVRWPFPFLTNFIIITSFTLLIIKLCHWYFIIKKNILKKKVISKEKFFLSGFVTLLISYITPSFYIFQQPYLVINHNISMITFTIVTLIAILGLFIEKRIFFIIISGMTIMKELHFRSSLLHFQY